MSDNVYHDHLDVCKKCRDNPFGMCPQGELLLREQVRRGFEERGSGGASPDLSTMESNFEQLFADL